MPWPISRRQERRDSEQGGTVQNNSHKRSSMSPTIYSLIFAKSFQNEKKSHHVRPTPKSSKGNKKDVNTKNKPFISKWCEGKYCYKRFISKYFLFIIYFKIHFKPQRLTSVDAETRAQALTPSPGEEATFTSIPKSKCWQFFLKNFHFLLPRNLSTCGKAITTIFRI